jgi:hypothetical protein
VVQNGSLCFLFKNEGSQFDGNGFKMLAALNQHCCPDSVSNTFTMLMLLFNDSMTKSKEIMVFCLCFDGMVNDMAWCKITGDVLLLFFASMLQQPPGAILVLDKDLKPASLDSIVADVRYHNEFKLVGSNKKPPAGEMPHSANAAANVNKQRKE